mgnify:CR=1 FL=1
MIGLRHRLIAHLLFQEQPIIVVRHSLTGEEGYQLYLEISQVTALIDPLQDIQPTLSPPCAPATHRLLRLEACSFDETAFFLHPENPLSAGLHWMIDFKKTEFIGKEVLIKKHQEGIAMALIPFKALDASIQLFENTPIYLNHQEVGYVCAAEFSYLLNRYIGYAYVHVDHAWPGVQVTLSPEASVLGFISAPFILPSHTSSRFNRLTPQ